MKKNFILITLMLLLISNIFAEKTIISVFKDSKNVIDLKKFEIEHDEIDEDILELLEIMKMLKF